MPRNLMIFSDGTAMVGGLRPEENTSNVYKIYRACRTGHQSPVQRTKQIAFYHAGLGAKTDNGSLPNPATALRRITNLAMGAGITEHVIDCYETILRHYQPGDRIFLIGFSRGAYTVRNVASVLKLCGIPQYNRTGKPYLRSGPEPRKIAAEAVNIYEHGAGKSREKYELERTTRARRFRQRYGSEAHRQDNDNKNQSNAAPYFIGVFDAVAALGLGGAKRLLVLAVASGLLVLATLLLGEFLEKLLVDVKWLSWLNHTATAFLLIITGLFLKFGVSRIRVIRNYPEQEKPSLFRKPGQLLPVFNFRWHFVSWKFKHFDLDLDINVPYARHAISINEKRADFDRVPWGIKGSRSTSLENGPEWFRQVWFAGDHTDIGGGHPHQEAGLSDISLQWMVKQLKELPNKPHLNKERLQCDPDPLAPQHCSVKSLKYMYPSWWPEKLRFSWPQKVRDIPSNAPLHHSVLARYQASAVLHEGEGKPYRPTNLQGHDDIQSLGQ